MARLTKHEWLEVEELYRQGWTQKQLSEKYKIRIETISVHMKKAGVKGGESIDVVKQEMEAAVNRKLKEFAAKRANRQIDTKEKMHTLVNTVLGFFIKDLKEAQAAGASLDKIAGSARALKEAMAALKISREELYTILEIREESQLEDTPDLFVMTMTADEENRIRGAGGTMDDEEMDEGIQEANTRADLKELENGNGQS